MVRRKRDRLAATGRERASIPATPSVPRAEWVLIGAITLLAAALRLAFPDRMAIEHFDEGVYASNIFFTAEEGGQYPYRHLYAPPLLPFLIEWGMIFLGPDSFAPFLPALLLGTATVPLAWWAVRCWFGPAAGLAAGFLITTSDFHLVYSRTALTDVPVAFFILLAVYLFWEAIRRESVRWSIAAGVATGLAWWTKYTGWLPLAIAASGSLAWVLVEQRAAGVRLVVRLVSVMKRVATMAITAFIVWSPVLIYLQPYGGYAAVAENHRGYLRPLADWPHNLWEQFGNVAAQSGTITVLAIALLAGAVPLMSRWPLALRLLLALWSALVAGWTVFEIGPAVPLALLALLGLSLEIVSGFCATVDDDGLSDDLAFRRLSAWMVAAWFTGMLATTPLYHPYPRLMLPWLLAAILGVTMWTRRRLGGIQNESVRQFLFGASLLLLPAASLAHSQRVVAFDPWYTARWTVPSWQDRTGALVSARQIVHTLLGVRPRDEPAVLYVAAGPAMFFQLRTLLESDQIAVVPTGDWRGGASDPAGVAAFVVLRGVPVYPYPERSERPQRTLLSPVLVVQRHASGLVAFDSGRIDPTASYELLHLSQVLR